MARFTVVFDACVLYPAPVRDLLMHLAVTDLFNARWTNQIHDEWINNLLENRPDLSKEQLQRTRALMDKSVREPLITNHEPLISLIENDIPDPDDAHVIAAAIKSKSDAIITFNLKDFPNEVLYRYHIEVIHPDDFVQYQLELNPALVCKAIKRHRNSLKNPTKIVDEYLTNLKRQLLLQTVQTLENYKDLI